MFSYARKFKEEYTVTHKRRSNKEIIAACEKALLLHDRYGGLRGNAHLIAIARAAGRDVKSIATTYKIRPSMVRYYIEKLYRFADMRKE